ncbi:MAG: YcgL domain-containing protein [Thiotrichaceae bacterium]|nr:YcgL domain-containing protein [Thiotrichaceae bacterium]
MYVYRSQNKQWTYLFLPKKDDFSVLDDTLVKLLGELDFTFEFELDKQKKLMQSDSATVLKQIKKEGFYLQLPLGKKLSGIA